MTVISARRLTAMGHELDRSDDTFGELLASSALLDDVEALRSRMAEHGYLFLPGLLDRDRVLAARAYALERMAEGGWLAPSRPLDEGICNPAGLPETRPDFVDGNEALREVLYGGAMMQFYDRFLGGPSTHFDFTWTRAMAPERGTPPHCDIVYMGRGTHSIYTSWTPLGDVSLEVGGLMILEGSHRIERLRRTYCQKDVDEYCTNRRPEPNQGDGGGGNIPQGGWLSRNPVKLRENLGGRWLTSNYRAGDVLIFTGYTVHASLDNHSPYLRLSSDSRYQLASEPIDERWMGEDPLGRRMAYKRGRVC